MSKALTNLVKNNVLQPIIGPKNYDRQFVLKRFPALCTGRVLFLFFWLGLLIPRDWLERHNKEITCLPLIHESPHQNQNRSLSKKLSVKKNKTKTT